MATMRFRPDTYQGHQAVEALGDITGIENHSALYAHMVSLYGPCTCPSDTYQQMRGGGTAKTRQSHLNENCRMCNELDALDHYGIGCVAQRELRQCPNGSNRMRHQYGITTTVPTN